MPNNRASNVINKFGGLPKKYGQLGKLRIGPFFSSFKNRYHFSYAFYGLLIVPCAMGLKGEKNQKLRKVPVFLKTVIRLSLKNATSYSKILNAHNQCHTTDQSLLL